MGQKREGTVGGMMGMSSWRLRELNYRQSGGSESRCSTARHDSDEVYVGGGEKSTSLDSPVANMFNRYLGRGLGYPNS